MKLRIFAKVFGVVFLLIGVLGFIPAVTSDGLLFNIFFVDTVLNLLHILTGVAALLSARSEKAAQKYFKVFGSIYAVTTVLGFLGADTVLRLFGVNMADNLLHLVIALAALALGFSGRDLQLSTPPPAEPSK